MNSRLLRNTHTHIASQQKIIIKSNGLHSFTSERPALLMGVQRKSIETAVHWKFLLNFAVSGVRMSSHSIFHQRGELRRREPCHLIRLQSNESECVAAYSKQLNTKCNQRVIFVLSFIDSGFRFSTFRAASRKRFDSNGWRSPRHGMHFIRCGQCNKLVELSLYRDLLICERRASSTHAVLFSLAYTHVTI